MHKPTNTQVKIAVVGHTNAGKTSLLRTLTRDRDFGEVSMRPATTRHSEATRVMVDAAVAIEFDDTPGLEDPMGLLDILHTEHDELRTPGPERLKNFLRSDLAHTDYAQEAKAIKQLLASDLALYVVDAREPVAGKYTDEFVILNLAGKPILAVLNFVASTEANVTAWRKALQNAGIHNIVAYDSVVFEVKDEIRLLSQLALLLPTAETLFERLTAQRLAERRAQSDGAAALIAEMVLQCARYTAPSTTERSALEHRVRERERHCNRELLALFNFVPDDYVSDTLPIEGTEWHVDPFDAQALTELGLGLGSAAAKGAAAGAALDLMTGFTSLGAATVIGGAVGVAIDAGRRLQRYVEREPDDTTTTRISDDTLLFLARRACRLVAELLQRGHAATRPIDALPDLGTPLSCEAELRAILSDARRYQRDVDDHILARITALLAAEFTASPDIE